MKNYIIIFVIILGVNFDILKAQVYTPKGTFVESMTFSNGDIALFESQAAGWLNSYGLTNKVQRVGGATAKYNCHSFAWNTSEGGEYVWIDAFLISDNNSFDIYNSNSTPSKPKNISKYWEDNSYVQVSNENIATKVWYGSNWIWKNNSWNNNRDHSAIILSNGLYKSKWGKWPLYIHAYNHCPYNYYGRKFYMKPINIIGTSFVCSNATYTVENLPAGASVTWSVNNGNLELVSGQGTGTAVFNAINKGECIIQVQINILGRQILITKHVDVRQFDIVLDIADYEYCGLTWFVLKAPVFNNASYVWKKNGNVLYGVNDPTIHQFELRTPHGTSENVDIEVIISLNGYTIHGYCNNFYSYRPSSADCDCDNPPCIVIGNDLPFFVNIYPNPTNGDVTINLTKQEITKGENAKTSNIVEADLPYNIQIWNAYGMVKQVKAVGKTTNLNIGNLPKGIYFIHLIQNGKTYKQQITLE